MSDLTALTGQALAEVAACQELAALEDVRVRWLGKKGALTEQLKALGALAAAERPAAGARINEAKVQLQAAIEERRVQLERAAIEFKLAAGRLDVTLPGRGEEAGGLHPVTQARLRIETLFRRAGFEVAAGPEIEDDFHNFEALNIPANHPARAMHDTFYFADGRLLRTHTSPVQIRALKAHGAPLAIIAPGRVYRCDSDMTHSPMFHQLEGLVVGENVSFANMKAALHGFLAAFFEQPAGDTSAALVLPLYRALRRSRHVVRVLRGQGLPHLQAHRLARDLRAAAWCTRTCCARAASTRSASPATPSGPASTAWRCCATG